MTALFTEYRLVVEGWGAEAVTSPDMEKVSTDGVVRKNGLLSEGMIVEESVDIAAGEAESSGMSLTIVDEQYTDFWTIHCAQQPQVRTWLTGDVDAVTAEVDVYVDNTTIFAVDDYIHIGTECLQVETITSGTDMTATRAHRGTIAQAHYTEDGENLTRPVVTKDYPMALEGRRAFLYEYRLDEHDLQGDGDLIWRGIVGEDTVLAEDGCSWTIMIDSLYSLLQQDAGGDTEGEFSLRGYYYSNRNPLTIRVIEYTGATTTSNELLEVTGHFETTDELVDHLNASWPAAITGLSAIGANWQAVSFGDHWGISFETDGAETTWLQAYVYEGLGEGRGPIAFWNAADVAYPDIGGAAKTWVFEWDVQQRAPRGFWGPHSGADYLPLTVDNQPEIIYPDGLIQLNLGDTISVQTDEEGDPVTYEVTLNDDTNRRYGLTGPDRPTPFFDPSTAPRLKKHTTYVRAGTLADLRDALTTAGPVDANRGASPFITTEDLGAWDANVERAAAIAGPLATRSYVVAQATKLDELIANECRLLGLFPRLQSDGKIGMGFLELPSSATPTAFDLDDSNIIISDAQPKWERNGVWGSTNTVQLLTGYNPQEDEHAGPTFRVRDVTSLSVNKTSKEIKVEPKSLDAASFDARNVTDTFRRLLGVFGRPYSILTVQVPYTLRPSIYVGGICSITSNRLPNVVTGGRGISNVKGMVISRQWDLTKPYGTIKIIVSDAQLVGYTPTLRITGNTAKGGNEYALDVDTMDPANLVDLAPPGFDISTAFPVDTRVQVMEWDSSTQTSQSGTVTITGDTQLQIDFDAAPTFTGTRYLRFAAADDGLILSSQTDWAYMADASSIVGFTTGDETAAEFAA